MDATAQRIDLLAVAEMLHEHLTETLCEDVFDEVRTKERRRQLGLTTLAKFWTAVLLRAPASLSQALAEANGQPGAAYPDVGASDQAFFQRCEDLEPEFFRRVFEGFRARLEAAEPARYGAQHAEVAARFGGRIWAVDGGSLDPVARRLKVLWRDRRTPIPGTVIAFYDLRRGTLARLRYERELQPQEGRCAREALEEVPEGTLLLGDRLYGVPVFLEAAAARRVHALVRRNRLVAFAAERRLTSSDVDGARVTDELGYYGLSPATPTRKVRLIRWKAGRRSLELITDVLDPAQLSAQEAVALYRERWGVERLFFELKEVLNLHRFYGANANAVAMQVYAAAIVHVALKTAQGRIAHAAKLEPERLSCQKLFPKVAATSSCLVTAEQTFRAVQKANPRVRLRKPDWHTLPFAYAELEDVLVEPRSRPDTRPRLKPDGNRVRGLPDPNRRSS
ncbi:MAG TPA: IS4 family transposase [Vicinamibacterales bacterium]